jgi:hypothetical protein
VGPLLLYLLAYTHTQKRRRDYRAETISKSATQKVVLSLFSRREGKHNNNV